jgi:hypothetical protein
MAIPDGPIDLGFNPYESPLAATRGQSSPFAVWRYRSGHDRAIWTMVLLSITAVFSLAKMVLDVQQYQMLDNAKHGNFLSRSDAATHDDIFTLVGLTNGAMVLIIAIPFLMWTHRVYQNLGALGAKHLEHSPGWAVGWWFVPIANFIKPCMVMAEIWRHSVPERWGKYAPQNVGANVYAQHSSGGIVLAWWCVYMFRVFVGAAVGAGSNIAMKQRDIDGVMTWTAVDVLFNIASIGAAALAISMIWKIDANQDTRFESLQTAIPVAEPL